MLLTVSEHGPVRVGGLPSAPKGTRWPACATCTGPMQFLAQVAIDRVGGMFATRDQSLLIFQCANDPGLCDEWEPDGGGNAAVLVPRSDVTAMVPPDPGPAGFHNPIVLPAVHLDAVESTDAPFGQLCGTPEWIQGDETPRCRCGRQMDFVLSLEQHATTGINFGRGVGYGFACATCEAEARWLFQC